MSASVLGTFVILAEAPALYDDTKPIDVELSVIAQQIYNLTLSKHKTWTNNQIKFCKRINHAKVNYNLRQDTIILL